MARVVSSGEMVEVIYVHIVEVNVVGVSVVTLVYDAAHCPKMFPLIPNEIVDSHDENTYDVESNVKVRLANSTHPPPWLSAHYNMDTNLIDIVQYRVQ